MVLLPVLFILLLGSTVLLSVVIMKPDEAGYDVQMRMLSGAGSELETLGWLTGVEASAVIVLWTVTVDFVVDLSSLRVSRLPATILNIRILLDLWLLCDGEKSQRPDRQEF